MFKEGGFDTFRKKYSDYDAVIDWIYTQKVLLFVDELNVIPVQATQYNEMSAFLDSFVAREGCGLIYTSHHKIDEDFNRHRSEAGRYLSEREHKWMSIPRFKSLECIRYWRVDTQDDFWSAVMRGRIPALCYLTPTEIQTYTQRLATTLVSSRQAAFDALLTGDLEELKSGRNLFRSFAYSSERSQPRRKLYAWAPFMIAQRAVLGKDCPELVEPLESPRISEAKAFEALVELSVLVRLMSTKRHPLVPRNANVPDNEAIPATEMFHVGSEYKTLDGLQEAVAAKFNRNDDVQQVVAVPLYEQFQVYDFFVLHRTTRASWNVVAGYKCKKGTQFPDHAAAPTNEVGVSIWVEGRSPTTRQAGNDNRYGWRLLTKSEHLDFLGESIYNALPPDPSDDGGCHTCQRPA